MFTHVDSGKPMGSFLNKIYFVVYSVCSNVILQLGNNITNIEKSGLDVLHMMAPWLSKRASSILV